MYVFIKITFLVYIKVIHTYTIKINLCLDIYALNFLSFFIINTYTIKIHLCLKLSFFIYFFLSDGTQGNKHTEQFLGTDGEGQSHSSHNHYAAEKLTLCIGFQS